VKRLLFLLLLSFSIFIQVGFSQEALGTFSDVQFIEQEGDCVGLEVKLWRERESLSGQLRDYEGPCEAETLPIQHVKFNPRTGNIEFKVYRNDGFVHVFNGVLEKDVLTGEYLVAKEPIPSNAHKSRIVLKKKRRARWSPSVVGGA